MATKSEPPPIYQFPMECCRCAATTGVPYRATTVLGGGTKVDLRCRACGHEWSLDMEPPAPALILVTKEDRRKVDDR